MPTRLASDKQGAKRTRVASKEYDDCNNDYNTKGDTVNTVVKIDHSYTEPNLTETIGTELDTITPDTTSINLAFKPTLPPSATCSHTHHRDVVVLLDLTISMAGNGIVGLRTVMSNFDRLLTQAMLKESLSTEEQRAARANMNIMFAFFGSSVGIFEGVKGFVSAESGKLNKCLKLIAPQLKCRMNSTNIEDGIQFGCESLLARFNKKLAQDRQRGICRTASIVLVTDGSPNQGRTDASEIILRHVGPHQATATSMLDEQQENQPISIPISTFAVGLGDSVDARFLSTLVDKTGFWHYAADPRDPSEAFSKTLGVIATAKAPYVVRADVTIIRGNEERDTSTTRFNFGMMTSKNLNPIIIGACAPNDLQIGDKLRCTINIGRFHTDSITIDVSHKPAKSTKRLFAQTKEVESSLDMLRYQILNNPQRAYEHTLHAYAASPVAIEHINATMNLMAHSQGFGTRDSFVEHLSCQPTMDYVPIQHTYESCLGGIPLHGPQMPSLVHSFEASFSQSSFS